MVMQCLNLFQQVNSNGKILKSLTWTNVLAIVQEDVFLKLIFEYPKELRELHTDYPLASDKIRIKRKILSEYQLKIANLYNIPIDNVEN